MAWPPRLATGLASLLLPLLSATAAFAEQSSVIVTDRGAGSGATAAAAGRGSTSSVSSSGVLVTDRAVSGGAASSEDPNEQAYTTAVTINPVGALLGVANADLGLQLTPGLSLNLRAALLTSSEVSGFGAGAGLQIFPGGKTFQGFFLYPLAQYSTVTVPLTVIVPPADPSSGEPSTTREEEVEGSAAQFGGLLGYQFIWSGFTLRLGGGLIYTSITVDSTFTTEEIAGDGVGAALDVSLGGAF